MGLNDRDYARDEDAGFRLRAPESMVGLLIVINAVVFVLDALVDGRLSQKAELDAALFTHPWEVWQLVTYGFLHSSQDIFHLLFNMLGLFFFGRELEAIYGKWEFLRIYLAAIIVGGLVWVASQTFVHHDVRGGLVGASAAVACIVLLFAMHFPRRMLMFWGILPVPAWLLGAFLVVTNMLGALRGNQGDATAYEAHLAGLAFAGLYFRFGWNLGRWLPESVNLSALPKRRPGSRTKLKLHTPQDDAQPVNLDAEVDRLLAKIHSTGYDSLSADERRTLERASARYQKRRQ